jgi:hypothetical protein
MCQYIYPKLIYIYFCCADIFRYVCSWARIFIYTRIDVDKNMPLHSAVRQNQVYSFYTAQAFLIPYPVHKAYIGNRTR